MTNTALLEEEIKNSGLKKSYLAQKLGLSRFGLAKKISGETEFKASEIVTLCTELKITSPKQRDRIFFGQ